MLQFLDRAGQAAVRIADEPVYGFLSVHLADICHCHLSRDLAVTGYTLRRHPDRRIFEISVAQTMAELIHRSARNVLIQTLCAAAAAVAPVIIYRNLPGSVRECDRKLSGRIITPCKNACNGIPGTDSRLPYLKHGIRILFHPGDIKRSAARKHEHDRLAGLADRSKQFLLYFRQGYCGTGRILPAPSAPFAKAHDHDVSRLRKRHGLCKSGGVIPLEVTASCCQDLRLAGEFFRKGRIYACHVRCLPPGGPVAEKVFLIVRKRSDQGNP